MIVLLLLKLIRLEPEGLKDNTIYPNGISTSLPEEVQLQILAKIKGLEHVKMKRAGYAIEYDFVDPRELKVTLETKKIKSLFFVEGEKTNPSKTSVLLFSLSFII